MRDSLGGSMLLNIVIIFASLVIIFFAGILSYSKAYKVKNRTIELLEKYQMFVSKSAEGTIVDYNQSNETNGEYDVMDALGKDIYNIGYDRVDVASLDSRCKRIRQQLINSSDGKYNNLSENLNDYVHNFCVFKKCNEYDPSSNSCIKSKGYYFVVVTFVRFDFPVIGDMLMIPVYGETKMLGKQYDY